MSARSRLTLLAGAGFFLVQLGWILAIVPHYGIDEFDHALRSSSVAAGHWEPSDDALPRTLARGDLIPVRADVAASIAPACTDRPYTETYNCRPIADLPDGKVMIASAAARYNPTYYAVVGVLAAPFHGNANLYALRIATAVLGAILFAATIWLAAGRARTRWPVLVLVLGALPTTIYSASIATPNGLQMLSGAGVWVALLAVATDTRAPRRFRSEYALLAAFVMVLANTHSLGLLWLALIGLTVSILRGPLRLLRDLVPRSRWEYLAALLTVGAVAFEIAWVLLARTNDPANERTTIPGSPVGTILNGLVLWPLQIIGAYPMRDNAAPAVVYVVMLGLIAGLAVLTWRRTRLWSRPAVAAVFIAGMSFAVGAVLTAISFHQIGAAWQGRYSTPFAVGLFVIAGYQLDHAARPPGRARLAGQLVAAGAAFANVISQVAVVSDQAQKTSLVQSTGWHQPSTALLITLAVLAAGCWSLALSPERAPAVTSRPDPVRVRIPA